MRRENGKHTEAIDRRIDLEKVTMSTLMREMDAEEIEVARLTVAKKELAYPALTTKDAEAQKRLAETEQALAQRTARLESYRLATATSRANLDALQKARADAIAAERA